MLQVLLLYVCFEVRYTALFFPVVAVAVFICSAGSEKYKLTGIVLSVGIVFFAAQRQARLNERETHTRVFSAFSGWQIANNALHCYKQIEVDPSNLPSDDLRELDKIVRMFIDSVEVPADDVGAKYIWDMVSPLKVYHSTIGHHFNFPYFNAWFAVSPVFDQYGWYIVKNHTGAYMRYYILPNARKYFYPDLETVSNYNASDMALSKDTKEWFSLDVDHLSSRAPDLQLEIMPVVRLLALLLNTFIIIVFFVALPRSRAKWRNLTAETKRLLVVWGIFYFGFMAFSIFATSVNLRFMDPVFVLGLIMPFALLERAKKIGNNNENKVKNAVA